MAGEERVVEFAVQGDPAGDRYVRAPAKRADMAVLDRTARAAGERFYCAERAGGCGGVVMVVNGPQRAPHFRHHATTRSCVLRDADHARDRYTHAIIQDALVGWLRSQGLDASKEYYLDRHSRVDVFSDPNAVIEVQLSGMTAGRWVERTTQYGGNVTWLFDDCNPITGRDAALQDDGVVLLVRLRPFASIPDWQGPTSFEARSIDIGWRRVDVKRTEWFLLEECRFSPRTGIEPPGFDEARNSIAEQRARIAEAQRLNEEAAARIKAEQDALKEEALIQALARLKKRPQDERAIDRMPTTRLNLGGGIAPITNMPGPRPTVFNEGDFAAWEHRYGRTVTIGGPWWKVIRYFPDYYPEWTGQMDGRWATGLPGHLVDPAWAALYSTCLHQSAPIGLTVDLGVDHDGLIIQRLAALELVKLYPGPQPPGQCRSQHRLAQGTEHPPPWLG